MGEPNESQSGTPDGTSPPDPTAAIEQHAIEIATAQKNIESLLVAAHRDAQSVAEMKELADKTKASIDETFEATKASVAALGLQLESARVAASELSALATSVQAASTQSNDTAKQASAAIESAKQLASSAAEIIGRIEGIRDEAIKTQATIAERNEFIQRGLEHVAEVQRHLDAELDAAKRAAGSAEAHNQATKATSDNVTTVHGVVQALKEKVEVDGGVISSTRAAAEGHASATKRLAELAESTEARVAQYESKLTEMQKEALSLQSRIDLLLLGATNAGLASAFDKRSSMFRAPEKLWQWTFVGSLAGLLALAVWAALAFGNLTETPDWEQLTRMTIFKLPFWVPLIWIAIHAARQASLAKRMEEEYAFKATTSNAFEGYRRQMAEVGSDLNESSPLGQLCINTLKTIAAPPGRVYEKQRMDPSPGSAAAEIIEPVVEGVSKALVAKLPDVGR